MAGNGRGLQTDLATVPLEMQTDARNVSPESPDAVILWSAWKEDKPVLGKRNDGGFSLAPNEVHIWAASLDLCPQWLAALQESLAADERQRAARFRFELHQHRFIAARGWMREVLSRYLNSAPGDLEFCYGPYGKPSLAAPSQGRNIHFNLAHAEGLGLLAITYQGAVGIDVERVRVLKDAEELVERFFSTTEASAFRKISDSEWPQAFFNLWTRKEAWLKATGEGIGNSLHRVEVSFLPGTPACLERLPADLGDPLVWSLHDLSPAVDFVAALAIRAVQPQLSWRQWNWAGMRSPSRERSISK